MSVTNPTLADLYARKAALEKSQPKTNAKIIDLRLRQDFPPNIYQQYLDAQRTAAEGRAGLGLHEDHPPATKNSVAASKLADQVAAAATGRKMKAEADGKEWGYENPPFDPRIMSWKTGVADPSGGAFKIKGSAGLQQGYFEQDKNYWKATGQTRGYKCRFLYNPSTISVDYQLNTNILPTVAQTTGQLAASALLSNMQSITFNLLFDRTYEVGSLSVDKVSAQDQKRLSQGVYADVAALERVCAIYRTTGSTLGGQGPMLMVPATVVFGKMGLSAKPLSWYGYIAAMGVDYTHFGSNMTPMRATVAITFAQLVKVDGVLQDPKGMSDAPVSDTTAVAP